MFFRLFISCFLWVNGALWPFKNPDGSIAVAVTGDPSAVERRRFPSNLVFNDKFARPSVLASVKAHAYLQDPQEDEEDSTAGEDEQEGSAANAEKDELSKAEGEAPAFEDVESGKDEGGSNPEKPSEEDASAETEGGEEKEGKDTDAECIEEEKELDKAQEKIKHAQEELNKLQIREKAKEAEELEKRADTMAETEAEEADDEKLSGEA